MIAPDANVLVEAWNPQSEQHRPAREWLEGRVAAEDPLGISELVLSGALRVLTLTNVARLRFNPVDVLELVDELLGAPGVVRLRPGARHWGLFRSSCDATAARGNQVPDCYHAALAIEHGATWASHDNFFATVPGLSWVRPY